MRSSLSLPFLKSRRIWPTHFPSFLFGVSQAETLQSPCFALYSTSSLNRMSHCSPNEATGSTSRSTAAILVSSSIITLSVFFWLTFSVLLSTLVSAMSLSVLLFLSQSFFLRPSPDFATFESFFLRPFPDLVLLAGDAAALLLRQSLS